MFSSTVKGKKGILTGGSSGYGYEMVCALQKAGADVAVFSADEPSKENLKNVEDGGEGKVIFNIQDLLEEGASKKIVAKTMELFGTIDFVIVNAGFAVRFEKPLLETPTEEVIAGLRTQFEIFPVALTSLVLDAARIMAPKYEKIEAGESGHKPDSGAVIVTLSEAAVSNLRDDLLAYAAAKKASEWIMQSLAVSLGDKNIRLNGIAPGFANTEGPKKFYSRYPQIKDDVERLCHLKPSFMHPGSIVPAMMYLLTDNYVTGQTIALDGGYGLHTFNYFQQS
jgi:NAD(P)-dependent dehydrogenase (short-subunit alcohol dehydrogenase family)